MGITLSQSSEKKQGGRAGPVGITHGSFGTGSRQRASRATWSRGMRLAPAVRDRSRTCGMLSIRVQLTLR